MEVITPFDFVQMFPERRTVAIVGNASSLLDTPRGDYIESHDVVVRFNECAMDGFSEYVGTRTDILVSNPYPEKRKRKLLDGGSARVLLIINPQTRRGDVSVFSAWAGGHRVLFTYTPDLVGVEESTHIHGLTTGTYALQLLWRTLIPSKLLCTGFTMFDDEKPAHYWQSERPPGLASHDMEAEANLFVRIINSIKVAVEVTSDVVGIAERTGRPLLPHIKVI